jgi:hypothetical protein
MSMDYFELAALAKILIDDAGRSITVIRFKQTANEPAKPWKGPGDPTTVPDASSVVRGVFVGASGGPSLGISAQHKDLLVRCKEICLVDPLASFDLSTADEIVDGGVHWKIEFVDILKPADTVVLYIIGVSR